MDALRVGLPIVVISVPAAVAMRDGPAAGLALIDHILGRGDLPDYPPLGPRWDFDDEAEMRKRYPRLYAIYLTEDE